MTDDGGGEPVRGRHRRAADPSTRSGSAWRLYSTPLVTLLGGIGMTVALGVVTTQPASQSAARTASPAASRPSGTQHPSSTAQGPANSAPGYCTPPELSITTTTNRSEYSSGSRVTVVTKLKVELACDLYLVPNGTYHCGEGAVIDTWSSEQVFPAPGQKEQCGSFPQGLVETGTTDTATIVWDQQTLVSGGAIRRAPPGHYEAVGSWSWRSGSSSGPYEAATSAPFTLVP